MHAVAFISLGALSLSLSGCTLVGLSIGAATPRYREVSPQALENETTTPGSLTVGEEIRIRRRGRTFSDDGASSPWLAGRYGGVHDGQLLLEPATDATETYAVAIDDVAAVRARRGSYWALGLGIGALIDVALVAAVAAGVTGNFETSGVSTGSWRAAAR